MGETCSKPCHPTAGPRHGDSEVEEEFIEVDLKVHHHSSNETPTVSTAASDATSDSSVRRRPPPQQNKGRSRSSRAAAHTLSQSFQSTGAVTGNPSVSRGLGFWRNNSNNDSKKDNKAARAAKDLSRVHEEDARSVQSNSSRRSRSAVSVASSVTSTRSSRSSLVRRRRSGNLGASGRGKLEVDEWSTAGQTISTAGGSSRRSWGSRTLQRQRSNSSNKSISGAASITSSTSGKSPKNKKASKANSPSSQQTSTPKSRLRVQRRASHPQGLVDVFIGGPSPKSGSNKRQFLRRPSAKQQQENIMRASNYDHVHQQVDRDLKILQNKHQKHLRRRSFGSLGGGGGDAWSAVGGSVVSSPHDVTSVATSVNSRHRRRGGVLNRLRRNPAPPENIGTAPPESHPRNHKAISSPRSAVVEVREGGDSSTATLPLGTAGLVNLGNTCFLNSSIQCLSATIPLTDYFLGYDYQSEINYNNFLGTGGKLVTAYAQLMREIWMPPNRRKPTGPRVVDPRFFKHQVEQFAPQFAGTSQHDAQEFLAYLLDGIHEDLNRIQKKPYIEHRDCDGRHDERDAVEAWKNHLRRDKSIVVDMFQGQMRSSLTCLKCQHRNVRFEPFMYLSVPITESCRTLDDCLHAYLAPEKLTGENQWYCTKCKTHRDAMKKTDLWILPPVLILHLKRFRFTQDSMGRITKAKNKTPIRYPLQQWELHNYLKTRSGDEPRYDLYGVSNHMGGLGSGHYTAYTRNRLDQQWYHFNDARVEQVPASRLEDNHEAAYVLYYHRNTSGENSTHQHIPMVRRQSESRPDLWPHSQFPDRAVNLSRTTAVSIAQVAAIRESEDYDDDEESLRLSTNNSYRSSSRRSKSNKQDDELVWTFETKLRSRQPSMSSPTGSNDSASVATTSSMSTPGKSNRNFFC